MDETGELELEGEAEARGALEEVERALRCVVIALYIADFVICIDLLTNGVARRYVAARWAQLVEARRRRAEWNRARLTMLFEAITIVEEGE